MFYENNFVSILFFSASFFCLIIFLLSDKNVCWNYWMIKEKLKSLSYTSKNNESSYTGCELLLHLPEGWNHRHAQPHPVSMTY